MNAGCVVVVCVSFMLYLRVMISLKICVRMLVSRGHTPGPNFRMTLTSLPPLTGEGNTSTQEMPKAG